MNAENLKIEKAKLAEEVRVNNANIKLEADKFKAEQGTAKYNKFTEQWYNWYVDAYLGESKETCNKALKTAKTALKKAKTPTARYKILLQMRGIYQRLGVIANAK